MKQIQYDDDGTPFGYKYVLVGMYWYGEEPKMYLDKDAILDTPFDENFDDLIKVELALDSAIRNQHPDLEVLDLAFIYDGIKPDYGWRVGTWEHAKEVVKHLVWRLLLAIRTW
jgi:hypothetical protein